MNIITKLTKAGLLALLVISRVAVAQRVPVPLDNDPVFANVITHRIHYPVKPATRAIYGRFYAGFTIDERGRIQDISVLYPKLGPQLSKRYGFDYEILTGLKHLPPLNPKLAGTYALPVAFCFTHYGEGALPIVPTNTLPASYDLGNRALLSEVKIFATSPSSLRGLSGFPASKQIDQ